MNKYGIYSSWSLTKKRHEAVTESLAMSLTYTQIFAQMKTNYFFMIPRKIIIYKVTIYFFYSLLLLLLVVKC